MRVIAEFVDSRNGKRYGVGEGWKIDPPLEGDQVDRLKAAGVLRDGDDPKVETPPLVVLHDLDKMSDIDVLYLAMRLGVSMSDFESRAGLVAGLKAAQERLVVEGQKKLAEGVADGTELPDLDKMTKPQLEELAAKHTVDLSGCTNNAQRADRLKAAGVGA